MMNPSAATSFALFLLFSASIAGAEDADTGRQFFENLRKVCGQSFEGATEFPQNADHPMVGKKLIMSVTSCSDREIRMPLQVGDDKSRTWVLTLSEKGLLLKHDHRHPDGTPDKQTNYGGWAQAGGTTNAQSFPADADTTKLIPEAATNVWTLRLDLEKQQFTYALQRDNAPRYRAVFLLRTTEPSKNKANTMQGKGTFKVKMTPQRPKDETEAAVFSRMSLDKQFQGDLEATSQGEMLAVRTEIEGSAGYVAIERVTGKLLGRNGSFHLQHSGTMTRSAPELRVTVIPDSGTGELKGLAGSMTIKVENGKHFYEFDCTLQESS